MIRSILACRDALRHARPRFGSDQAGGMALLGAASLVPLVAAVFIAIDFSSWSAYRIKLQQVADSAAIAAARELQMSNATPERLSAVAREFAMATLASERAGLGEPIVRVVMIDKGRIQVELTQDIRSLLSKTGASSFQSVTAKAVAKVSGGLPVCLIGLDPAEPKTVRMDKRAKMSAEGCAIYSNSKHMQGLRMDQDAVLTAGLICSSGGVFGKGTSFTPAPLTDCPQIPDPLAVRAAPAIGACLPAPSELKGASFVLNPGTYCGGLKISDKASVIFRPGVYVIKDGEFKVEGGASIKGEYVGFYLTGVNTRLNFTKDSAINLTAPKDGPLAGMLFFEDRSAPLGVGHRIQSDDAGTLLGTIYLSRGTLLVDADKPVAEKSASTVIVARQMELNEGPNLVLNTNYGATDIPAPNGVGPSGKIALAQ